MTGYGIRKQQLTKMNESDAETQRHWLQCHRSFLVAVKILVETDSSIIAGWVRSTLSVKTLKDSRKKEKVESRCFERQ